MAGPVSPCRDSRILSPSFSHEQRSTCARSHPQQQIGPPLVSHNPKFSPSLFSSNLPDSFWCFFFSIGVSDYANNRARKQILSIDLELYVSLLALSLSPKCMVSWRVSYIGLHSVSTL
jgi:hypothetical protein